MDFRRLDEKGLTICPQCGKHYKPKLTRPKGDNRCIQDIFPNAEPWEREQLITGLCSDECWNRYVYFQPRRQPRHFFCRCESEN